MSTAAAILPSVKTELDAEVRYFAHDGCVDYRGERASVYVGGRLVGMFSSDDPVARDLLVVVVCSEPTIHIGRVAEAFDVHRQTIRRIRDKHDQGGLEGVVGGHRRGRPRRQTPQLEQKMFALFDEGLSVRQALVQIGNSASLGVAARVRKKWANLREREREETMVAQQLELLGTKATEAIEAMQTTAVLEASEDAEPEAEDSADDDEPEPEDPTDNDEPEPEDPTDDDEPEPEDPTDDEPGAACDEMELEEAVERGARRVQHLGAWIMLAMLNALGIYALAERLRARTEDELRKNGKTYLGRVTLRVALDAVVVALSIGKRYVEGVRWLDTPSGPTLLRRARVISASWCRRVLSRFACDSALELHWQHGTSLMRSAVADDERAVFYNDNHVRTYTGKHTIRKTWRMQDKRARPGVSDFYVHDEQGRPLVRIDDPSHGSLAEWLLPIGRLLRTALGDDVKVLQVFDRGGAYPESMAELRNDGLEFVTYERAPYQVLPDKAFKHKRWFKLGPKRYRIVEQARKNLGKGRGRVRRIYVQTEEGKQLSVLAISEASKEFLVAKLVARWPCQENQFKHAKERWGSNQLDGRRVEPYPQDEVIPNPARRRLDRELRIARAAEGEALRRLAVLNDNDPKAARYEQDIEEARALQRELEELRPEVPTHAAVKDTDLAGKLKRHPGDYKVVIDTLRIALANAESDLAAWLAPALPRPKEAKKHLAKLLAAPGTVRTNGTTISVALEPAGSDAELDAFDELLPVLNALRLVLSGDPSGRVLRFKCRRK